MSPSVIRAASSQTCLLAYLRAQGVAAGLHYPISVQLQQCYEELDIRRGALPVTETVVARVISLPIFPEFNAAQVEHVCAYFSRFGG